MGTEHITKQVQGCKILPPPSPKVRTWEEGREEDGHSGGRRQTELMVEMMERGVREETGGARVDQVETGGARSRRSQVGPRPQP